MYSIDPIDIILTGIFAAFCLGVVGIILGRIDVATLTLIVSSAGAISAVAMKLIKDNNCLDCQYREFASDNIMEFRQYQSNVGDQSE